MRRFRPWLVCCTLMALATVPRTTNAEPRARPAQADEGHLRQFKASSDALFKKTKASVDARLANLGDKANNLFDQGTEIAIASMTAFIEERLAPYKSKLFGVPPEADQIYAEGKKQFEEDMKALAVRVANVIADEVAGAKSEIKAAEAEIAAAQAKLPASVKLRAEKQRAGYAAKLAALGNRAAEAIR